MSSRPGSGSKISTGHRRSESSDHHRPNSATSSHRRSDSGQSVNSDFHVHQKHIIHNKELDKESCNSACKYCFEMSVGFNTNQVQNLKTFLCN